MSVVEYTHQTPIVNSSLIKKVWYASPVRELYVEMDNGSIYGYKDVSPMAYENLLLSDSKGAHYNKYIKGAYRSTGDTYGLEFRPAPDFSRKYTDAKGVSWASSAAVFTGPAKVASAPAPVERNYRVTGLALAPSTISRAYKATSMEDAMEKFRKEFAGKEPEVTEVRKA